MTDGSPAAGDILRAVLPSFYLVTPDLRYRRYLLAEEPEVHTAGGRMTVRFRVRDDAFWSDGEPIGVNDVAFTARVMKSVEAAHPEGFDHLVRVVEEGPRRGRLVLEPPLAAWRELFSAGRFVLPAHVAGRPGSVAGWDDGPPVAGGPFSVGERVAGRSVTLEANPRFFGPRPLVRRLEVAFVPDPTTAVQLLRGGLVDAVAPMLGISWGRRLADLAGVATSSAFGPDLVHLVIQADALAGSGLRRRLADAVDRDRFAEVVIREEGRQADGVLAPEQPQAVPAWARYGAGPARDAEAGRELSLVYTRGELLDLLARYVRAELEGAGTDVELVPVEADVFQRSFLPDRRFDLALWEARTGPAASLEDWVRTPGGEPVSALRARRVAALAARAATGDGEALREAQARLARLAPVLPLFQPRVTMAWREKVGGIQANPTADGPLWNAWAWSKAAA